MNSEGQNIAQITWNYGAYPQRIKEVLRLSADANEQLKSVSTFQVSKVETGNKTQTQTIDRKSSHSEPLYYQSIKDENEKTDIEIWMDAKYRYTKSFDENRWSISPYYR